MIRAQRYCAIVGAATVRADLMERSNMRSTTITAAAALIIAAASSAAYASSYITDAKIQRIVVGGFNGKQAGCLYVSTSQGLFTYPLGPIPATDNAILLGGNLLEQQLHETVSFTAGPPSPTICNGNGFPLPDGEDTTTPAQWQAAPTIVGPAAS